MCWVLSCVSKLSAPKSRYEIYIQIAKEINANCKPLFKYF